METRLPLVMTVVFSVVGVLALVVSIVESERVPFGVGGLGIAVAGFSIEMYLRKRRDTKNERGIKRSEIEKNDERNILINAKTGETSNMVMDIITVIVLFLAIYLEISHVGQLLIFSILLTRVIIHPIVKRFYEHKM
jgi:hypothetical protein